MTTEYVTETPGPWYCDDSAVLCDGVAYTGTLYPYNQNLPTLDGTFPDPIEFIRNTAAYDPFVRNHGTRTAITIAP